jgi:hypothetical protein
MNRWALRPTDNVHWAYALIGTSMVMDCFCKTDIFALLGASGPFS